MFAHLQYNGFWLGMTVVRNTCDNQHSQLTVCECVWCEALEMRSIIKLVNVHCEWLV